MLFSIITTSYNTGKYLEQAIISVVKQRQSGIDVQYIVVDGCSSDATPEILKRYSSEITHLIVEPDSGPANALNKGLRLAAGDMVAWLNADDFYYPNTLARIRDCATSHPQAAMCFGRCPIVDQGGREIRSPITLFKEMFFPLSSRFTYQCINYLSQPALFFRKEALVQAGPLREDMVAAWDYDFILKLWHWGPAVQVVGNDPLAAFRWHPTSISGQHFAIQFREEYEAAVRDAGLFSPQALLHYFVRWGIVGSYHLLALRRSLAAPYGKG
ncbi:glycosyltransferase family 2 protein [Desulfobulbus alkaliphilus]|uniref:glycosyltransferase family 2 protein n=1 Tax=Desulfobulbus alkaliphilus TaxID=869814 RepID=UPI00196280E6|nr:glycosyltransferase family 2 protein [Desulfobulbus alkaliphilus]MBM9538581.1 glycosyltransferase [Desulfobulbus alkaliphilus]